MQRRFLREYLFAQALTYLITGVLLTLSHHLYINIVFRYIGHLFIVMAFLVLISQIRYKWMHQVADYLDIVFGSVLLISTFATGLIFFIFDEVAYYIQNKSAPQVLAESSFSTILIVVYIWVGVMFYLAVIEPLVRRRLSRTRRLFSTNITNFMRELFLNTILLTPVFLLSGLLSFFTKALSPNDFWGVSLCLICLRVALYLRSPAWRTNLHDVPGILFSIVVLFLLASILYIWTVAFTPGYYWAPIIWLTCIAISFLA